MARVNVYLPDDLAERARAGGLNISGVTQDAIRAALDAAETDHWLAQLETSTHANVDHEHVIAALNDARSEFGD